MDIGQELLEAAKLVEELLDGKAEGDGKMLCGYCNSQRYNSRVGIVHYDTCPLVRLRNAIAGVEGRGDSAACETCSDKRYEYITVCARCLQASCWKGEFLCEDAMYSGILLLPMWALEKLALEDHEFWHERKGDG